jgi:hypothetical protein
MPTMLYSAGRSGIIALLAMSEGMAQPPLLATRVFLRGAGTWRRLYTYWTPATEGHPG